MLNPRVEIGVALAFAVAILWGLYQTSQIDLAFSSDLETFSGPRAYPGLILIAMLTLCLAIAGAQFRGLMRGSDDESDHHTFLDKRVCWSAGLLVALCVFILAFERIGYVLTMVPLLTLVACLTSAPLGQVCRIA